MKDLHLVGSCYFCEKMMIGPETKITLEERKELSLIIDSQLNRLAGQIGKRKICKDCLNELQGLIAEGE